MAKVRKAAFMISAVAENPGRMNGALPADSAVGDFETAFAGAPVKIDAIYTTPYQNQAPMEPHATMASWDGPMLTVHTAAQLTIVVPAMVARATICNPPNGRS